MKFPIILTTILVASAIQTQCYTRTDRRVSSIEKRQASNADQMVQNILNWLQDVYVQNSRSILVGEMNASGGTEGRTAFITKSDGKSFSITVRQGTLREYLPPSNTEKPRPFQPGYPPAGYSPEPPFPIPTNPATGGVTAPEGYQPGGDNDILLPPDLGYQRPKVEPGFTLPTTTTGGSTVQSTNPTTLGPQQPTGTTLSEQPGSTTQPAGIPTVTTEGLPGGSTLVTGYPDNTPASPFTSQPATETQTGYPPYTSPTEGAQTTTVQQRETTTTQQTEVTTPTPTSPSTTETTTTTQPTESSSSTTETPTSTNPATSGSTTLAPVETPSSSESAETITSTTISPETNTIPGPGKALPSDEDLKHPPHIHSIDVQCSKEMMTINLEFNRVFDGVIYSKGHYSNPECRYVQENSAQTKYTFTVSLDKCGTEFVNAFDTQNQSYLENVLVLQNEPGIQEVWDTVRSVRCLWEGNIKDTLSVAFSIGMLSQEIITFSGDTAMAKLDVLLGRGPLGQPANGLVKIGEEMTLAVSVSGDPGFDLQVKDCKAVDAEGKNSVALTDEQGCILKPKLFGAFQKTRDTGSSGASIIAYAYFNAFKFPDEMDLMIECNIELCKTDCDICPKDGQQVIPAKRRRRDVSYNDTITGDWVTMGKLVRVILPEDLNKKAALELSTKDHICMTIHSFVFSTAVLVTLLIITSFISLCLYMKKREKMYLKY